MKKFARIIELKNGCQVLLTINYDQAEECFKVFIETSAQGYLMATETVRTVKTLKEAQKIMNNFSEEEASIFNWEMYGV